MQLPPQTSVADESMHADSKERPRLLANGILNPFHEKNRDKTKRRRQTTPDSDSDGGSAWGKASPSKSKKKSKTRFTHVGKDTDATIDLASW
jgi:hypothetical protein